MREGRAEWKNERKAVGFSKVKRRKAIEISKENIKRVEENWRDGTEGGRRGERIDSGGHKG